LTFISKINTTPYMLGIVGFFVIFNAATLFRYANDIPYWDEWYRIGTMPDSLDLSWVTERHNEHMIIFQNLFIFFSYKVSGFNIYFNLIANLITYVALVLALIFLLYRPFMKEKPYLILLLLPMFSRLMRDNLTWPFMLQMHQMILFSILAIYFGFRRKDTIVDLFAFVIFCGLGIFSMSFTYATGILFVFAITKFIKYLHSPRQMLYCVSAGIFIAIMILIAIPFSEQSTNAQAILLPWQKEFWNIMRNHLGRGIPNFIIPFFLGGIFVAIGATVKIILEKDNLKNPDFQAVTALLAAVLLSFTAIFIKRHGIGYRHLPAFFVIIPGIAVILDRINGKWLRRTVFWGFLFVQVLYWPRMMFISAHYKCWHDERTKEKRAYEKFVLEGDRNALRIIIPEPHVLPNFERTTMMDFSFRPRLNN